MKKLVCDKKTGFKNDGDEPIIINDFRGVLFYDTSILRKKVKRFNLPEGVYFVQSGKFSPRRFPVEYKIKSLPVPERKLKPVAFKIKFGANPNKATVFHDTGDILFDESFKDKPLYILFFILYHEQGHTYYKSEKGADAFARAKMLKKGFNPSQIGLAPLMSLSSHQYDRKQQIINDSKQ